MGPIGPENQEDDPEESDRAVYLGKYFGALGGVQFQDMGMACRGT